ncbi:hypothetical protein Tco_1279831 [Tanacetum coccineum]
MFEVKGLLRVINNTSISNLEFKGVTTRCGKTTTQDVQDNDTNIHTKKPLVINHDEPVELNEVLAKDQPQKTDEPVVRPTSEVQTPLIHFPQRLRKEKEEAQQKKLLENLKQLHINLPFIEALTQMPEFFGKTARAMIDVFNKKITLRVGDDEVIFDMDQSIKRPPAEDGLEKSIDQSDLESCESFECDSVNDSDSGEPIRRIESVNTPYPLAQKTTEPNKVKTEQLYSASTNEIDEKKPELKNLPQHLEYDSFKFRLHPKIKRRQHSLVLIGPLLTDECRLDYAMHQLHFKDADDNFPQHGEDLWK